MITAIFDANNILMRSLFTSSGYGKDQLTFNEQEDNNKLARKLAMDISYILRFLCPDKVIFAVDSSSWRKNIKIDENDGYKANREKNQFYNWTNIFKTYENFLKILISKGFIVSRIDGAEGDDMTNLWMNEITKSKDGNVIIVSGDEDIRQLVGKHNDNYCLVYNPFLQGRNPIRKMFVPIDFEEWLNIKDEIDIFNMDALNNDKSRFDKFKDQVKFIPTNGQEIILRKMFLGDDGDNIPSIYTWTNQKNLKKRFTKSLYEKLLANVNIQTVKDLDGVNTIKAIKDEMEKLTKTDLPFNLIARIQRQKKLVELNSENYPESINEAFEFEKNKFSTPNKFNYSSITLNDILKDTEYLDKNYKANKPKSADIFKEVEKLNALF